MTHTNTHTQAGNWDEVHTLAQKYIPREEAASLLVQQAGALELKHRYADAEKMYLSVGEPDLAINM